MKVKRLAIVFVLIVGVMFVMNSFLSGCFCYDEDAAFVVCNQWCGAHGTTCHYTYPMYTGGYCKSSGYYCKRAIMMVCVDGSNLKGYVSSPCPEFCGPMS